MRRLLPVAKGIFLTDGCECGWPAYSIRPRLSITVGFSAGTTSIFSTVKPDGISSRAVLKGIAGSPIRCNCPQPGTVSRMLSPLASIWGASNW